MIGYPGAPIRKWLLRSSYLRDHWTAIFGHLFCSQNGVFQERAKASLLNMNSLVAALLIIMGGASYADLYITVSGANVKKARIAVGRPHSVGPPDVPLSKNIRNQVFSDLEMTGLFEFVPEESFQQLDQGKDLYSLSFEEWGLTGASFVLRMGFEVKEGTLLLEALLYDVTGEKKVFGTRYKHPVGQFSRLVHTLVEDILKELTGERGLFNSRILMVCRESKRNKEIYIVDSDGSHFTRVTYDKTLSLSPAWSPDGKTVAYTQFERRYQNGRYKTIPVLKVHTLSTGERKIISEKEGMNSGAAWSPKGNRIAATLSLSGRPELYLLNSDGSGEPEALSRQIQWKRISGDGFQPNYVSLLFDVEPSWSPDSGKIVFSSARTGHPMIYIVDVGSKVASQLTFAGTYNATPAWSPRGDKIVFAAQRTKEGHFELYVIDSDGNNLGRLTSGEKGGNKRFNNENPSWAPTGRHLAFASNEGGKYGIYVMTFDGTVRRRISPHDRECSTPAWGPSER